MARRGHGQAVQEFIETASLKAVLALLDRIEELEGGDTGAGYNCP
jgi:hypothetical protein